MTEPVWPTAAATTSDFDDGFPPERAYHPDMLAQHVIDMCRAAWLTSVDDPSASPVGEVRRSNKGIQALKYSVTSVGNWIQIGIRTTTLSDSTVKGWTVIGAVPGTLAAEVTS